jgi:hypothetical protein
MDFILSAPYERGTEIVKKAYEQVHESKLFARWVSGYQHVSFDEFKHSVSAPKITKTDEEILADVKSIIDSMGVQNG